MGLGICDVPYIVPILHQSHRVYIKPLVLWRCEYSACWDVVMAAEFHMLRCIDWHLLTGIWCQWVM